MKNVIITSTDPKNTETEGIIRVNGGAIRFIYGEPSKLTEQHLETLRGLTKTTRTMKLLPVGHPDNPLDQPRNIEIRTEEPKFKIVDLDAFAAEHNQQVLSTATAKDLVENSQKQMQVEKTAATVVPPGVTPSLFDTPVS